MKFGYVNLLEQPDHIDYAGLLDNLREQAALCDEAGWEHVWLGEHHFGATGHDNSPNPFMIAADLGARNPPHTPRNRGGGAPSLAPPCAPPRTSPCSTRCFEAASRSASAARASPMRW